MKVGSTLEPEKLWQVSAPARLNVDEFLGGRCSLPLSERFENPKLTPEPYKRRQKPETGI